MPDYIDRGGAAFPCPAYSPDDPADRMEASERLVMRHGGQSGMTMRQFYAAAALQGLLAAHADTDVKIPKSDALAKWAFDLADAMIAHEFEEKQRADEEPTGE